MCVKVGVESLCVYKIYGNIFYVNIFFKRKYVYRW